MPVMQPSASIKVLGCVHLATQVASAEIVCHRSDFAEAAGRWEGKESGGAGEFWFSNVLGLEGPMSPRSAFMRCFMQSFEWQVIIWRPTRGGHSAFLVSPFGDAGCSATPCRASKCRRKSEQNATIWQRVLLNLSTDAPRSSQIVHTSPCRPRLRQRPVLGATHAGSGIIGTGAGLHATLLLGLWP